MSDLSLRWFVLTVDVSIKTVLLATAAVTVLRVLRVRNSNLKHAAWLSVLLGMLALPLLSAILPAVRVPLPIAPEALFALDATSARPTQANVSIASPTAGKRHDPTKPGEGQPSLAWRGEEMALPHRAELDADAAHRSPAFPAQDGIASVAKDPAISGPRVPTSGGMGGNPADRHADSFWSGSFWSGSFSSGQAAGPARWLPAAMGVWLAGVLVLVLRLLLGLFLGRRLVRRASVLEAAPGARLPEIAPFLTCESAEIRVPVSTGLFGPTILLPSDWRNWSAEKLHDVLVHEQSHLQRKDHLVALVADLCRCVYWFHPVAWWVSSRLAALAEEACDDAAIVATGNRTAYARHLLEIAGVLSGRSRRVVDFGLSMARQSSIESRINAILDLGRPLSSRLSWPSALWIAAVVVPIVSVAAALRPSIAANPSPPVVKASETKAIAAMPAADAGEQPKESVVPQRPPNPTKDSSGAIAMQGTAKPPAEQNAKDATFAFAGTVVGPDGRPVDRAKVSLSYLRNASRESTPATAFTDHLGRFAISVKKSRLADALFGSLSDIGLVAEKEGFGFAYGPAAHFETTGRLDAELTDEQRQRMRRVGGKKTNVLELVLDDVPVRGRLVNTEGRPIPGAKVEVVSVVTQDRPLDAWEAAAKKDRKNPGPPGRVQLQHGRMLFEAYPGAMTLQIEERAEKSNRIFMADQFRIASHAEIVPAVRTDADGRFTLKGLGRDRIVEFVVSAPGFETTQQFLRTRRGELIRSWEPVYPSEFTLVAAPSVPVEGHVLDSKTGQHLAGVRVQSTTVLFSRTLSDADGKYRLEGLPSGSSKLLIIPPKGSQHLAGGVEVKTTLGSPPVLRDIKLTKGVLVRGRATDARTREAVHGTLNYYAYLSNPHIKESDSLAPQFPEQDFITDVDGRFEVPVLSGPGILCISAGPQFPFGVGRDRIGAPTARNLSVFTTAPRFSTADRFNLLLPLDPQADAKTLTVSLTLRSASDVTGRVLSPEGQPLTDYFVSGLRPRAPWPRIAEEQFKVFGYSATETRRLIFYHPGRNLAGYYDLTGKPPAALEIKLLPAATLVGRILGMDGQPLANASIFSETRPLLPGGPRMGPMGPRGRDRGDLTANRRDTGVLPFSGSGHPFKTDAQGRFELKGIIPGLKYTAKVEEEQNDDGMMRLPQFFEIFTDLTVASAETKQLGDLKAKPDERRPGRRGGRPRSPAQFPPSD